MGQKKNRSGPRSLRSSLRVPVEAFERRLLMSTYTVNTLSDAATAVAGQLTLRQAVADANANGGDNTIAFDPTVFAPGSTNTITLTQGQIEFNDSTGTTTVTGPGESVLSISGGGVSRVMQIDAGAVVDIGGVTITDGAVATAPGVLATGGAIQNAGTLTLNSVQVTDSSAIGGNYNSPDGISGVGGGAEGGGLYSTGSLSIFNSVISGNTAPAGTSYYQTGYSLIESNASGGGIFCSGPLTMTGCTVSDNSATGSPNEADRGICSNADGGGIYATGVLSLVSTAIQGNSAHGGAPPASLPDLIGFAIVGGNSSGGGVFAGGAVTLTSAAFSQNQAIAGNDSGERLGLGNSPGAWGGAIFCDGALVVTSSSFTANQATGSNGPYDDNGWGGDAYGGAIAAVGTLTLTSSTVSSNAANGGQGSEYGSGSLLQQDSAFGGGVYASGDMSISTSTISGNTVTAGQTYGDYGGDGGYAQGGGVFAGGTTTIASSSVTANSVKGGLGCAANINPAAGTGGPGEGGGIYASANLGVINSTLEGNQATGGKGGPGNSSFGESYGGNGGAAIGGAIYAGSALALSDSTIVGNSTTGGVAGAGAAGQPSGTAGTGAAAGVAIGSVPAVLMNSIVSDNISHHSAVGDISGTVDPSSSHNFIGVGGGLTAGANENVVGNVDPELGSLANNGGSTLTMLPLAGSPVIAAGSVALIPAGITTDQRGTGYPRIVNGTVDIGAVEYVAPAVFSTPPSVSLAGTGNQAAVAGKSYTFALGSFAETNAAGPFNITINWGDGSTPAGLSMAAAGAIPRQSHTFADSGTDTVTVSVADADGENSSSASFTVAVAAAPLAASTITLSTSTIAATFGNLVELTADVAGTAGQTPTGTVSFSLNGSVIGTSTVADGVATLRTTTLPVGSDAVTASYSGDGNYSASSSSPVVVTIAAKSRVVPSFSRALVPSTAIAGQKVTARLPVILTNTPVRP